MTTVSAVIPTYNRSEEVGRAIKSVLSQSHDDLECIVVDDGSSDQTSEILATQTQVNFRTSHRSSDSSVYGLDTVSLRYFNVFGPGQDPASDYATVVPKFGRLLLDGERPHIYGDGTQSRDFTYIQNVLDANVRVAESAISGEVFNIATGGQTTVNELVNTLNELLNTSIEPGYGDPRPGDIKHSYADISKAKRLLDYEPAVSFEDGLQQTIDALR